MGKNEKNSKKVAALENDYTKEQYVEFQKQQKQLIFRRRRLAAIFLVAFHYFCLFWHPIDERLSSLRCF